MCFSASASFTASALLFGMGALALYQTQHRRERLFAAMPIWFALQQFVEGLLWIGFKHPTPWLTQLTTPVFAFFSHVWWPIYVPLAVLLLEPAGRRRQALWVFSLAGLVLGGALLTVLLTYPVQARVSGQHIEYLSPHFRPGLTMGVYLLTTTVSPMLSSHRLVRWFGVLSLLAFVAVYAAWATWFISVWCFFAALLSGVVCLHFFDRQRVPRPSGARITLAKTTSRLDA
jgi:hypothetical protein